MVGKSLSHSGSLETDPRPSRVHVVDSLYLAAVIHHLFSSINHFPAHMNTILKLTLPVLAILLTACGNPQSTPPNEVTAETIPEETTGGQLEWITLESGLSYSDMVVGEGAEAEAGMKLEMHYTGWLYDENAPAGKGDEFDSSRDRDRTFDFVLGSGMVIKGWDLGLVGMKPGGRRMLKIPPDLGYGADGRGPIPGDATMLFDVEIVAIQ